MHFNSFVLMFIETQKINSKKLTIAMSRTSLKVVGPKYIRQVLDARFSFFGSNSQWRLPSDSVEHATRYTAKHKLIAVCRATSVIYRQPTQPTEQAESVAHNKETKRTHTHTHSQWQPHEHVHNTAVQCAHVCVSVCARHRGELEFPVLRVHETKYGLRSCYTLYWAHSE